MKRTVIAFLIIFISISLILPLSGCGPIISIEGVELREVEKITKEILPDEIDTTFTPDGSLPIGSYILLGKYSVEGEDPVPMLWKVIENKSHYRGNIVPPVDHMTLLTAYIIDLRGYDGEEPESDWEFRAKYGNNRYSYSNIRQWLNTSQKGGQWWEPQHDTDAPPLDENFKSKGREIGYADGDGFLTSFNEEELGVILETTLESGINNNADGGGTEMITDRVFLLSLTEVGLSDLEGKNYFEGNPFVIFDSNESRYAWVSEQCYDNTNSLQLPRTRENTWDWWLRSPYSWGEYDVWMCDDEGTGQHRRAHIEAIGIRPAINISYEEISFSGNGSMEDPYTIDW